MKSPVVAAMEERGISTLELSVIAACDPSEVSKARSGGSISQRILTALRSVGCDTSKLLIENDRFRAHLASEVRDRVMTRMAAIPAVK